MKDELENLFTIASQVNSNDIDFLKLVKLIIAGAEVDTKCDSVTSLMLASIVGNIMIALFYGYNEIVKLLLKKQ